MSQRVKADEDCLIKESKLGTTIDWRSRKKSGRCRVLSRSRIRRIGEIVVIGWVSLVRSIDLPRVDREGPIGRAGPTPLSPTFFLWNRCEIVELHDPISSGRRVAQTRCPPIVPGFLLYTDFAREIETRSHYTRRNREGKKKIAAGNNCIVASRHSWNLHFSRFLSDRH